MGLVEDDQVPVLGFHQLGQVPFALGFVERGNDAVVQLPVCGIADREVGAIDPEVVEAELVLEVLLPLAGQARWNDEKDAARDAPLAQRGYRSEEHPSELQALMR